MATGLDSSSDFQSGWGPGTTFTPAPIDPDALEALRKALGIKSINAIGCVAADTASSDSGHACPGQVHSDHYWGADGHIHVAVSVWYSCDSHLEIIADVVIP